MPIPLGALASHKRSGGNAPGNVLPKIGKEKCSVEEDTQKVTSQDASCIIRYFNNIMLKPKRLFTNQ